jgi:AraC family transcriptional regulator
MEFATAHCHGLSVTYLDSLDRSDATGESDDVRVLVPGGGACTFHAFYRTGRGRYREALLNSSEVCVVPPSQPCEVSSAAPADLMVLSLAREFCEEEARESMGYVSRISELRAAQDPLIRSIGNSMRVGFRVGLPPSPEYLEAISHTLARHLNEKYGSERRPVACRGLSANRLKRVLGTIEARLGESILVADLAAEAHMSPFHFARMFKHTTGQAPHVYITAQRMERAKSLLMEGSLSLAEIARRVGYQTQAHFTGVFHANVGLTPRQFRVRNGQRPQ